MALIEGSGGALDQTTYGHILLEPVSEVLPDSETRRSAVRMYKTTNST
jgi:hypothetical protein